MNKALLVGALLLATGAATAIPMTTPTIMAGQGPLTEDLLLGFLGGSHPDTVRIISYNPDPVERIVSWDEHVEMLKMTSFGGSMGVDNHNARLAILTGSDEGFGIPNSSFFCDDSSAWVAYGKDFALDAGAAYTRAEDLGDSPALVCGGGFGDSRIWDLQLSVYPVIAGMSPRLNAFPSGIDGCFSTVWTVHASGYCPASQTVGQTPDTFGFWNANGVGVKATLDYGTAWFDYFLGYGAETTYSPTP